MPEGVGLPPPECCCRAVAAILLPWATPDHYRISVRRLGDDREMSQEETCPHPVPGECDRMQQKAMVFDRVLTSKVTLGREG